MDRTASPRFCTTKRLTDDQQEPLEPYLPLRKDMYIGGNTMSASRFDHDL
jgi:hypothetical protein